MIINKENQEKIKTIASKMSKLGLGSFDELKTEFLNRYIEKQVEKIQL